MKSLWNLLGIFIFSVLPILTFGQALKGDLTVGGISPDYQTISEVIDSLVSKGIDSSVVVQIRPGEYNEQIVIPNIPGSSAEKTVTFTSEEKDSTSVQIVFNATPTNSYTIRLSDTKHIRLEYLSIRGSNSSNLKAIEITGNSDSLEITHNQIQGVETKSTSTNLTLIYINCDQDFFKIESNYFINGAYGIYYTGGTGDSFTPGLEIIGNTFEKQRYRSISLYRRSKFKIYKNKFHSLSHLTGDGIYLASCTKDFEIVSNEFQLTRGNGIQITGTNGTRAEHGLIANNMISMLDNSSATGIYFYHSDFHETYHNSINLSGTGGGYVVNLYYSDSLRLFNNVFSNEKGNAVFNANRYWNESDNNIFHTSGSDVMRLGTDNLSIEDWKARTNQEENSLSSHPKFVGVTDLHTTQIDAYKKGGILSDKIPGNETLIIDFDGDLRDENAPSIGADEFTPPLIDAGITSILNPSSPFLVGDQVVEIEVKNFGSDTIKTAIIDWSINGVIQPSINWLGEIVVGEFKPIELGNYTFIKETEYSVQASISFPNGIADETPQNNSLTISGIYSGLSGIYYVGGNSDTVDFGTIDEAITALENGGVVEAVTFKLMPGTYDESVELEQYAGSDCQFPITIESYHQNKDSVLWTYSTPVYSKNYLLKINNGKGITIKDITFKSAVNSSYGTIIDMNEGGECILIKNCEFIGTTRASSSYCIRMSNAIYKEISILENTFLNGPYGILISGTVGATDNEIRSNVFSAIYYTAINCSNQLNLTVLENEIETNDTRSSGANGIQLSSISGTATISKNKVHLPQGGSSIYLSSCSGTENDPILVSNNMLSSGGTAGANAFYFSYNSRIHVLNNTVLNYSSGETASAAYIYRGSNQLFSNNIFANSGPGKAMYCNRIDFESDNNCFYTEGEILIQNNSTNYAELEEWKTLGNDANSIVSNPLFVSNSDLHVNKGDLDGAGEGSPLVLDDFDGDVRNTPPDIGADEFDPSGVNITLKELLLPKAPFVTGKYPIRMIVQNSGFETIDSLELVWDSNFLTKDTLHWTLNLAKGTVDTLFIDSVQIDLLNGYNFEAFVNAVNETQDLDQLDDTLRAFDVYPLLPEGIYTVGNESADFDSISEVAKQLINGGTDGDLTFKIESGTYNGQFYLKDYPGNSCENQLTFESVSGDSSTVTFANLNTSQENYIWKFKDISGITIRNLHYKAEQNNTYGNVLVFEGNTSCITIRNNHFEGIDKSNQNYADLISFDASADTVLVFENNFFEKGAKGIKLLGSSSYGVRILNNKFENQNRFGVELNNLSGHKVLENEFTSSTQKTNFDAIYMVSCNGAYEILRNEISHFGKTGININSCNSSPLNGLVANNFISIGGTQQATGINLSYSYRAQLYHNNIHIYSSRAPNGYAINLYRGSNNDVRNNNFVNTGAGFALRNYRASFSSDYNNLFSGGDHLVENGSIQYADLAAYQTALSKDANSVSTNPLYMDSVNLHVNKAVLDGAGAATGIVLKDIDGELRNDPPDIGADEFIPTGVNIGLKKIDHPEVPFRFGDYPVKLILENTGFNLVDTIEIAWKVNDESVNHLTWTGALEKGETDTLNLGIVEFEATKSYVISSWVESVMYEQDLDQLDDTLRTDSLQPQLPNGIYTVGGVDPDFDSISQVAITIEKGGIDGDVLFNIRPGTYSERVNFTTYPGNECAHSIVFQAENGDSASVIITAPANNRNQNYLWKFNSLQGLTIQNLTFQVNPSSSSYGTVLSFTGESHCNTIQNNVIKSIESSSSSLARSIEFSTALDTNNVVYNNHFQFGATGVYLNGGVKEEGNEIVNNRFDNLKYAAIDVNNQNQILIRENQMTSTAQNVTVNGIIVNSSNGILLEKNEISLLRGNGITMNSCNQDGTIKGRIFNNFVSVDGTNSGIANHAMKLNYSYQQLIYHNNFLNVNQGNESDAVSYAFNSYQGGTNDLKNNNFIHKGVGYAIYTNRISFGSDYNNFYSESGTLGFFSGNRNNLSEWQSIGELDANSLSIDPLFISTTDLHVQNVLLDKKAAPIAFVDRDFDGQKRDLLTPDIGADEFTNAFVDAGIVELISPEVPFATGEAPIVISLLNNAVEVLDSATIQWEINGVLQTSFEWNTEIGIAPGAEEEVEIGNFTFDFENVYSIRIWVENPNGLEDENHSNDTLKIDGICSALAGVYTIGGETPDFIQLEDAVTALKKRGVSAAVTFKIRKGEYNEQVRINRVNGSSLSNSIVFEPENIDSIVLIKSTSVTTANNYLIHLDSARNIHFRNLRFSSNKSIVRITGDTKGISFTDNQFQGLYTLSSSVNYSLIYANNSDEITVEGNRFRNGSYAIYSVNNSSNRGKLEIRNNAFIDQGYRSVYSTYNAIFKFQKNTVEIDSASTSYYALNLTNSDDVIEIEKNTVLMKKGSIAFHINSCSKSFTKKQHISNNYIDIESDQVYIGIQLQNSGLPLLYNTIRLKGENTNSRVVDIYGSKGEKVLNNILYNNAKGYALYLSSSSNSFESNNNDLYTTGDQLIYWNTPRTSLTEWRIASGQDLLSLSADPLFLEEENFKVTQGQLEGIAKVLTLVTDDIEDQPRSNATPDIGADEFDLTPTIDIAILRVENPVSSCDFREFEPAKVVLKNYGSISADSVQLIYELEGQRVEEDVRINLPSGGEYIHTFSDLVKIPLRDSFDFAVYAIAKNDINDSNDTILTRVFNQPEVSYLKTEDTVLCENQGVRIKIEGGVSYEWSTRATTSSIYVRPTNTTLYRVTVRNEFGCEAKDSILVTILKPLQLPEIVADVTTFCEGDSVLVSSNIENDIQWSTGETTQEIVIKSTRSIYLDHSYGGKCTVRSPWRSFSMKRLPVLDIDGFTSICAGDSTILDAKYSTKRYWSTGDTVNRRITVKPSIDRLYSVQMENEGCFAEDSVLISLVPDSPPGAVTGNIPLNGSQYVDVPVNLSWLPANGASEYNVYIWKEGNQKPINPQINRIKGINKSYTSLDYSSTYNWQVESQTSCYATGGDTVQFTTRDLSNLIVEDLEILAEPYSGQTIGVSWNVENSGVGATKSNVRWYDYVYLSIDSTIGNSDIRLSSVLNSSALQPDQSYKNFTSILLPEDAIGPYYIIVRANANRSEKETDLADNDTDRFIQINLSAPPDLEIVEIDPPGINGYAFSGEKIPLSWTTENTGTGPVPKPNWSERVYWSLEENYDASKVKYLGNVRQVEEQFLPNEQIETVFIADLPKNFAGTIYFYIITDYSDQVFEHLDEDNNITRSQPLDVLLTPPPDLEVIASSVEPLLTSSQKSTYFKYTVINDGGSVLPFPYWTDSLFISTSQEFDSSRVFVGEISNHRSLGINQSTSRTLRIDLPNVPEGTYYFQIKVDAFNSIYEGNNEDNNWHVLNHSFAVKNPDLEIVAGSVSDATPAAGTSIGVNWTVRNNGEIATISNNRFDQVWITERDTLDSTAVFIGTVQWNNVINAQSNLDLSTTIALPFEFTSGNYNLLIGTDATDALYEKNEANNYYLIPIEIDPGIWADLVPQVFEGLPDSITAGIPTNISFEVKNEGLGIADGSVWTDRLYISVQPTFHPDSVTLIKEFPRYQALQPDSSYVVESEITFPMLSLLVAGLDSMSNIYMHLHSDQENQIFEYTDEDNNVLTSVAVHVTCPPPVDLDITKAYTAAKDTINDGEEISLSWEVLNYGSTTDNWNYRLWYDGLYLSRDTIWDPTDQFVYDWTKNGPVEYQESYSNFQLATIPFESYGDFYLLLVTDHTDLTNDGNIENNVEVIKTSSENNLVHILKTPKPDLIIEELKTPARIIAGQPFTISWKVRNNGDFAVHQKFSERFHVSTVSNGKIGGRLLTSYERKDPLGIGEVYEDSVTVSVPVSYSGNYFLQMQTESTKQIYEGEVGEQNNFTENNVLVIQPQPSDLIIASIDITKGEESITEDTVRIDYLARNIGLNPIYGTRKDLIYLSLDSLLDPEDVLVKELIVKDTLFPYQEIVKEAEFIVPGVTPAKYFILVSGDAFNNLYETNENNNIGFSSQKINLELPELIIEVEKDGVLKDSKDLYFSIIIPDSLVGETMLITLESDVLNAHNELYLKLNEVPSTANADYLFEKPFSSDQLLIVESLDSGTYYLLVKGEHLKGNLQNTTLLASILPFEIRDVNAKEGGNTGNVTLSIDGAKFDPNMTAKLVKGADELEAVSLHYLNSTRVYATFNLSGTDLGFYDLVLEKSNDTASLSNGFEVVTGSIGEGTSIGGGNSTSGFTCSLTLNQGTDNLIQQELDYPSAVRRNRTVEINIYFRNNGNIDIPIPTRFLLSISGHPVAGTVGQLGEEKLDLFIEFKEDDGPPGILRPGASGVVRAYTRSFTSGTVIQLLLAE